MTVKTDFQPQAFSRSGLSLDEVRRSRAEYGTNELVSAKRNSFFKQLLSGFADPIIKILLGTLLLNLLLVFRGHGWFESVGIAIAIFLATFVSTLSEYGSESAFLKLQEDALKTTCRVVRSGQVAEIPVAEVVRGDIVLLGSGERVPADGIILSGLLYVDQSPLNGESLEVKKTPGESEGHGLSSKRRLYRGTVVCSGEGVMQVNAVGIDTMFGQMAHSLGEETRESPLKNRLGTLARTISRFGYIAAALTAVACLFNGIVLDNGFSMSAILAELQSPALMGKNLLDALTLALTVVVVAVPEGLPMMITVVLSSNMFRMMKDNVMVRKLVGIETSGSLNILFTDKTGTLTKGKLSVDGMIFGSGTEIEPNRLPEYDTLYRYVCLSGFLNSSSMLTDGGPLGGNTTDRALLDFVKRGRALAQDYTKIEFLPFDSKRKYSACAVGGRENITLIKGAPELLLERCTSYFTDDGEVKPFNKKQLIAAKIKRFSMRGGRIVLICLSPGKNLDLKEGSLILIGAVIIRDVLRRETKLALERIRKAGVQTVIVTGDSLDTASAIAKEAGIGDGEMITSRELEGYTDEELKRILPKLRVVARAMPQDKARLVKVAQELGLVCGMTGDGVNDAPALKLADVGFAMGSGTEVAREAGDIVILDDNISSIAKAILYGRTLFRSIQKFIVFQLTMNVCAVGVSIIAPFIGVDTPVTVIQMLWINIIMDSLAGLAFAGEPPKEEYMNEPPKSREAKIMTGRMVNQIAVTGIYTVILCVVFLKTPLFKLLFRPGPNNIYFMTGFFALFIFAGIFNAFSARTGQRRIFRGIGENRAFVLVMGLIMIVQIGLIYFGGTVFRTAGLTVKELVSVGLIAFTVIPFDMLRKTVRDRKRGRRVTIIKPKKEKSPQAGDHHQAEEGKKPAGGRLD